MSELLIRQLGIADYEKTLQAMQTFTDARKKNTPDELWLVQHPSVFTLGQQGERKQILKKTAIPIVQTDRGGHVTYHAPGQLVAYPLFDLRRNNLGPRAFVSHLEHSLIQLLEQFAITAQTRPDAPGVYVDQKKIASIGLRIRKGCSYHGLALNVDLDLTPFDFINPCGMPQMQMTKIQNHAPSISMNDVSERLAQLFQLSSVRSG